MLRDLERHIRSDNEGHVKVVVCIGSFRDVDLFAVLANVRLGDRRRSGVAELGSIEQAVAAARRYRRLGSLSTSVVHLRIVRTVDRYRHGLLRDLERHRRAGFERHVKVGIIVCCLGDVDLFAVLANVRLGDRRRSGVAELGSIEQAVAAARRYRRLGSLSTSVVHLRIVRTVDRDRQRSLLNNQFARCEFALDVIIGYINSFTINSAADRPSNGLAKRTVFVSGSVFTC